MLSSKKQDFCIIFYLFKQKLKKFLQFPKNLFHFVRLAQTELENKLLTEVDRLS